MKKEIKTKKELKALKCGWIPGTEYIIAKAAIKVILGAGVIIISAYVAYVGVSEGVDAIINAIATGKLEYEALAEMNTNILIKELEQSTNNLDLPPLETLTEILNQANSMSIENKVKYLIKHKEALIKVLNENSNLTENQVENLKEIVNHIEKIIKKVEIEIDNLNKLAMENLKKANQETNRYLENRKK